MCIFSTLIIAQVAIIEVLVKLSNRNLGINAISIRNLGYLG
ncbi:hypothetical protein PROSTU_01498 [Providencia stuartii ATCC 25827]|uniref:Uncharacterized protein n=1 Tax=Providencia stuartii ATCC 25827 TaxID=471874 RepID=A0AA86YXN1_PROST|nr:hypothetical protein PROSTU_01498 [Providencia stuartii ATCC 25827]